MTLTLCGFDIPDNDLWRDEVAASRIHKTARVDFLQKPPWRLEKTLHIAIEDCLGILRAVQSKAPRDINNRIIDRKTVRHELIELAADAKRIRAKVILRYLPFKVPHPFKGLCVEIDSLAKRIMYQVPFYKSWKKETLLLLGAQDKTSRLYCFPRDIINLILQNSFEIAVYDIEHKAKLIGCKIVG